MINNHFSVLNPSANFDEFNLIIENIENNRRLLQYETIHIRKEGMALFITMNISPVVDSNNRAVGAAIISRDITGGKLRDDERTQLLQDLSKAHRRLQVLSRRLVETQETERRAIAGELHDEVGQVLTGLKLMLEIGENLPSETVPDIFNRAQELVNELMEKVSALSLELRPPMLDELGMMPALLWQIRRFTLRTNIDIDIQHSGIIDKRLAPEIETAAYRIIQEALTNIARHAYVDKALLILDMQQNKLIIKIEDNGKGFDINTAMDRADSYGLIGMQERAEMVGGQLAVQSSQGKGTTISAVIPITKIMR